MITSVGSRNPQHLLLVLGDQWPGPAAGGMELSGNSLIRELSRQGFQAHQAHSMAEAIRTLKEYPIGSAILDARAIMGDLTGIYEMLHPNGAHYPCIIIAEPAVRYGEVRHESLPVTDELVRLDTTLTASLLMVYLQALLMRAYPSIGRNLLKEPLVAAEEPAGQVICVFSAKGGTGKTTIACNLAVSLAGRRQRQTVLVDGDLAFGEVDISLNVAKNERGQRTSLLTAAEAIGLADVPHGEECDAERLESFDEKLLDDLLIRHPSGLNVMLAPPRPELAERIHPAVLLRAATVASQMFDYTIVDMPSSYSESEIKLLDLATKIILVIKPEVSSLRNTSVFLEYANRFGWRNKIIPVLNRADSQRFTGISQDDVQKVVGGPVLPIPSSGLIPQAASRGKAVVETAEDGKVPESLSAIVDRIAGPLPAQPKRPVLRRLLAGARS